MAIRRMNHEYVVIDWVRIYFERWALKGTHLTNFKFFYKLTYLRTRPIGKIYQIGRNLFRTGAVERDPFLKFIRWVGIYLETGAGERDRFVRCHRLV